MDFKINADRPGLQKMENCQDMKDICNSVNSIIWGKTDYVSTCAIIVKGQRSRIETECKEMSHNDTTII